MTTRSWWCVVDSAKSGAYVVGCERDNEEDAKSFALKLDADPAHKDCSPHRAVELVEKESEAQDIWRLAHDLVAELRQNECTLGDVERAFREKAAGNYLDVASHREGISEGQREELYRVFRTAHRAVEIGGLEQDHAEGRKEGIEDMLALLRLLAPFRERLEREGK